MKIENLNQATKLQSELYRVRQLLKSGNKKDITLHELGMLMSNGTMSNNNYQKLASPIRALIIDHLCREELEILNEIESL
jgi:hypothetical protein